MKKNILLGVCGGISAYKTCGLVRLLIKNGYAVKVIMTESACRFVTPLTFESLSLNPVYVNMFESSARHDIEHISLAQWADICVIVPLSANTLSKIAHGFCDNLLTAVVCALPAKTKVALVPAMNTQMWRNPIIQNNIEKLTQLKKYKLMSPIAGELACGDCGIGRMLEPKDILERIKRMV